MSSKEMPRLRSPAGLRFVGTNRQYLGFQVDCISATQTPTKVLNETDSEFNQCKTILESDQKVTDTGLILNSSQMVRASREPTREAISSSRGIVICRSGLSLLLQLDVLLVLLLLVTEDKPQLHRPCHSCQQRDAILSHRTHFLAAGIWEIREFKALGSL